MCDGIVLEDKKSAEEDHNVSSFKCDGKKLWWNGESILSVFVVFRNNPQAMKTFAAHTLAAEMLTQHTP